MAWVRLHDDAVNHPKILRLSDKCFRLWIWSLSYCQRHLTDGLVSSLAIPARLSRATTELTMRGLWEVEGEDYRVHDYLDWNDSREVVLAKRAGMKRRVGDHRSNALRNALQPPSSNALQGPIVKHTSTSGVGSNKHLEEETSIRNSLVSQDLANRGARLLERYDELYSEKLGGAKHFRRQPALDHTRAIDLCRVWDDERLEKLAILVLTTDEDWISRTDRSFAVFATKATWADKRLTAWEADLKSPQKRA